MSRSATTFRPTPCWSAHARAPPRPVQLVLQQDPTVVAGEQGSASGVGEGAVSRPSVVTHEDLELERRQRGAAVRDGYFLLGYFLALAGLRSP